MDDIDDFELFSYLGANNARFGMVPREIAAILGPADSVGSNYFKQRIKYRSGMTVGYSVEKNVAVYFGFGPEMENTRYKDIFLFTEEPNRVLAKLIAEEISPQLYFGIVIFLDLGLALSGFHDRDASQKGVALFDRGTYDDSLARMTPFLMKKR